MSRIILVFMLVLAVWIFGGAETMLFPVKYPSIVEKYSAEFNLEPELILAVMRAESSFTESAVSNKNAMGLMQLMYETAKNGADELKISDFNEQKLLEPDTNIRLGCWYIRKLQDQYGSMNAMIAAYNAGGRNVKNWFEDVDYSVLSKDEFASRIKFKETKRFFYRVLNNYNKYKKIYKGNMEV